MGFLAGVVGFLVACVTGFFFCAVMGGGIGFLVEVVVMGLRAVVLEIGALRTGVEVVFLGVVPGMAFLVPMGWATMMDVVVAQSR
jgi:hypothetical protein